MRYFPQKCDCIYEAKEKNAKGKLAAAKAVPAKRRGRGVFKALRPFPVVYLISKTFLSRKGVEPISLTEAVFAFITRLSW